jgi:hypothetical protein
MERAPDRFNQRRKAWLEPSGVFSPAGLTPVDFPNWRSASDVRQRHSLEATKQIVFVTRSACSGKIFHAPFLSTDSAIRPPLSLRILIGVPKRSA